MTVALLSPKTIRAKVMRKANSINRELGSQSQSSKPSRIRKGRQFTRFLRGVGWTLLGLVALVAILAVLGMIFPPPRDPKSVALDDEDFGLGFKVGDKWDVAAIEAALKAHGLPLHIDEEESERLAEQAVLKSGHNILLKTWWSEDSRLVVSAYCDDPVKKDIRSIKITASAPTPDSKVANTLTPKEAKEVETMFPGDEISQHGYLAMQYAKTAGKLYPQVHTAESISLGSSIEDVISTYGKPPLKLNLPYSYDSAHVLYEGDGVITQFETVHSCITSITTVKAASLHTPIGRLKSWNTRVKTWIVQRALNSFFSILQDIPTEDKEPT
jgi:hypothetical protein